jgi:hypothetical protein
VLIASAIGALVLVALAVVFHDAFDLTDTIKARERVRSDAALAAASIERDVRDAAALLAAAGGALVLLDAAGDTVRYAWSSPPETLTRTVNSDSARVVAEGVEEMVFGALSLSRPIDTEQPVTEIQDATVASFLEGDWDTWIADHGCTSIQDAYAISNLGWAAEVLVAPASTRSITRVALRAAAVEMAPPQENLRVEVCEGDPILEVPGTTLAAGELDRLALTSEYLWHEITLSAVVEGGLEAGSPYWIIVRPHATGLGTYAGHIAYQRMAGCDAWPENDMDFRTSTTGGLLWGLGSDATEAYFRLDGEVWTRGIDEVTQTVVDSTGVTYRLAVRDGEEIERRAGHVAMRDL